MDFIVVHRSSTKSQPRYILNNFVEFRKFQPNIEGLPGVLGKKGTLAKYPREQENMSLILGNTGTKLYKLEEENIVSKFINRGTNTENVGEHGNIGQFWKGTRERGTPLGDSQYSCQMCTHEEIYSSL